MKQAGIYVNDVFCGILTEDDRADEDIPSQMERTHQPIISTREDESWLLYFAW